MEPITRARTHLAIILVDGLGQAIYHTPSLSFYPKKYFYQAADQGLITVMHC